MNIGSVTYSIEVDTSDLDKAERKMDDAKRASDELGNTFKRSGDKARYASGRFKKAGDSAKKLGNESKRATDKIGSGFGRAKTAVTAFTAIIASVGLVRGFASVIRATNEFNSSISELSAITGATGRDLEFLSRQSQEIGRTTTLSASQAATAFKLIASAKPDLLESGEALNTVTREAVTLAEAARIDLPSAANALGNALNQFGAGAEEANRFINVLAAGSKFGSSAITETAEAMKNAGAVANTVGLSFEETNAAIQALAAGGLRAGEAGTGLRAVLLKLEKTGNEAITPSIVGLETALSNLKDMGLDNIEMMDIFGIQSITAAETLLAQSDSVGELTRKLTGTQTAAEQASTNFDNLTGDTLAMKSATEGLQIAMGDKLTPALRNLTQDTTELLNSMTEWVETGGGPFLTTIQNIGIGIGTLALILKSKMIAQTIVFTAQAGMAATATGAWATATGALGKAMTFALGPIGLVTTAIVGISLALGKALIDYNNFQRAIGETAANSAREIEESFGLEGVQHSIRSVTDQVLRLQGVIARGTDVPFMTDDVDRAQTRIQGLNILLERLRETEGRLIEENELLTASLDSASNSIGVLRMEAQDGASGLVDLGGVADVLSESLGTAEFRMEGVADVIDHSTVVMVAGQRAGNNLIASLEEQGIQAGMTARALSIYQAVMEATNAGALPEQIRQIAELTARNFDAAAAATAATEAETERAKQAEQDLKATEKANERTAEAIAEEWRGTRDAFADFFVDLYSNGSSAFDSLLESFKNMVTRMVAQWVGSGIMQLLGMGGGYPGASGGFSLLGGGGGASLLGGGGGGFSLLGGGSAAGGLFTPGSSASYASLMSNASLGASNFLYDVGLDGLANSAGQRAFDLTSMTKGGMIKDLGLNMAAGFAGSFVGNELGEAVFGKQAESNIGATIGGAAGSLFGPLGTAVGSAIGSAIDVMTGGDGFKRTMSGMLVAPTTGAPTAGQFDVQEFASGFAPTGFAEKGSRQQAEKLIDTFRFIDSSVVAAVERIEGASIDLSQATLAGFGVDGTGQGAFMGASQRTTEAQLQAQFDSFSKQLGRHITGLDADTAARVASAKNAQELVTILEEIAFESEKTQEVTGALNDEIDTYVKHLDSSSELLFNSNGDLIKSNGAVVATNQRIAELQADIPAALQDAIDRFEGRASNRADLAAQRDSGASSQVDYDVPFFDGGAGDFSYVSEGDSGTHFVDGSLHSGGLGFSTQQQADRVGMNLDREFYGYNPITGQWDEAKGGMSAWWTAMQISKGLMKVPEPDPKMLNNMIAPDGSHEAGLNRVPKDGYLAELHQGERVLTSQQADSMDSEGMGAGAGGGGNKFSLLEIAGTILTNSTRVASVIRRWDRDGLPETRT